MASMQMASAEQMAFGDTIKVEAGSEVYAVRDDPDSGRRGTVLSA